MGEFRIGRTRAQHSYPVSRGIAGAPPSILQIGSDFLIDPSFQIDGEGPCLGTRVEKTPDVLLQVPLNGFRLVNGLWLHVTASVSYNDSGGTFNVAYVPWIEFTTALPGQFFFAAAPVGPPPPPPPNVVAGGLFNVVSGDQPYQTLSITLDVLFKLPAASSDEAPIAFPAIDDILVGIVGFSSTDVLFEPMTAITAAEVNASIITQNVEVALTTLPPCVA